MLYSAVAYAEAQNIIAIWIDQECNDQDDPGEKENAVQVMDIVYQEADDAIAILEVYLAEINSLASQVNPKGLSSL